MLAPLVAILGGLFFYGGGKSWYNHGSAMLQVYGKCKMTSLAKFNPSMTMSSREIAELTKKEHSNVMRDIRNMFEQLDPDGAFSFESTYLDGQNKERPLFNLPYRETMVLVSGYSVELRAKVVDRWIELENKMAKPVQAMLPDQVYNQAVALNNLNSTSFPSVNPNIIQMMRDYAQNNMMQLMIGTSSQQSKSNLIIGVVEIAKKYLDINLQKHGISVGRYVAQRIKSLGLDITKVERICTGEMRPINGYEEHHHAKIVEFIEQWIAANPDKN